MSTPGVTDDEKRFRITPTQQMMSSCVGALITSALVTPLDVVKIRLQSQQQALPSKKCVVYCNGLMDHVTRCSANGKGVHWVNRPCRGPFTSTTDAFKTIVRNEGVFSLWSGLPPTLVMAVPATMAYYVSYETLRVTLVDRYKQSTGEAEYPLYLPLLAACIARVLAVTVVSPLELIRTKMQAKRLSYQELKVACEELYAARGVRGFWLGYFPTLARDVPFSAIYWGCYEAEKKMFNLQNEDTPFVFSFAAGATAGAIAGTVTLPFDVVKTHKQIEMGEVDFKLEGKKLATSTEIAANIYKRSGIFGLFAGWVPRTVKVAPACAIMMATYEYGKSFFYRYNKSNFESELQL